MFKKYSKASISSNIYSSADEASFLSIIHCSIMNSNARYPNHSFSIANQVLRVNDSKLIISSKCTFYTTLYLICIKPNQSRLTQIHILLLVWHPTESDVTYVFEFTNLLYSNLDISISIYSWMYIHTAYIELGRASRVTLIFRRSYDSLWIVLIIIQLHKNL